MSKKSDRSPDIQLANSSSLVSFDNFWNSPESFQPASKKFSPETSSLGMQQAGELLDIFGVALTTSSTASPEDDRRRPLFSTSVDLSELAQTGRDARHEGRATERSAAVPSSASRRSLSPKTSPLMSLVSPSARMNPARLASWASRANNASASSSSSSIGSSSSFSASSSSTNGASGNGSSGRGSIFSNQNLSPVNNAVTSGIAPTAASPDTVKFARETRLRATQVESRLRERKGALVIIQGAWRVALVRLRARRRRKYVQRRAQEMRLDCLHRTLTRALILFTRSWRNDRRKWAGERIANEASAALQRWRQRSVLKFTLGRRLSQAQAHALFGLVLGWRVRRILKSPRLSSHVREMKDLKALVHDVSETLRGHESYDGVTDVSADCIIDVIRHNSLANAERALAPHCPGTVDFNFLKSIVRQMDSCRTHLRTSLLEGQPWRAFPTPGFLDLGAVLTAVLRTERALTGRTVAGVSGSPMTPRARLSMDGAGKFASPSSASPAPTHGGNSAVVYTPVKHSPPSHQSSPVPTAAWQAAADTNETRPSGLTGDSGGYLVDTRSPLLTPRQQRRSSASTPKNSSSKGKNTPSKREGSSSPLLSSSSSPPPQSNSPRSSPGDTPSLSPSPPPSVAAQRQQAGTAKPLPESKASRAGVRASLQIDILGADGLAPPRRAPQRTSLDGSDLSPGPVGDSNRKPFIRCSLLLPKSSTTGSGSNSSSADVDDDDAQGGSDLKRVQQWTREYGGEDASYPRWPHSISMPLPCPRSLVVVPGRPEAEVLSQEDELLRQNKVLLHWWARGCVKVEVIDSERFNSDTFLGEATFLLSSFLAPGVFRKAAGTDGGSHLDGKLPLESGGSLELKKRISSDRVSGVLHFRAYLHLGQTPRVYESPTPRLRSRLSLQGGHRFGQKKLGVGAGTGGDAAPLPSSPAGVQPGLKPSPHRRGTDAAAVGSSPADESIDMKQRVREQVRSRMSQRSMTRTSMEASVSKMFDSLAGVQQSTEGLLDKFTRKLEEKRDEDSWRDIAGEQCGENDGEMEEVPSPVRLSAKREKTPIKVNLDLDDDDNGGNDI